MSRKAAVSLCLVALLVLPLGLLTGPARGTPTRVEPLRFTGADRARAERTVFVAGRLSEAQQLAVTAAVQGSGHPGVVLFDSADSARHTRAFLKSFQPAQLVAVGGFPAGIGDLEVKLGHKATRSFVTDSGPPVEFQRALFPNAERAVIAPAAPRRLLLHAACLAGALQAPLVIGDDACLKHWPLREVHVVGVAGNAVRVPAGVRVVRLDDEEAVAAACRAQLAKKSPIRTFVVANPSDTGAMSALAPWVALQRHAALLLTNDAGDNVAELVRRAAKQPGLDRPDTLLLVGDLKAIPAEKRPNPIDGDRDEHIEMEPLTPEGDCPATYATGRLFHSDPNVIALLLARPRLLRPEFGPSNKALIVSNPGGGLPLLETYSRHTGKEIENAGYEVAGYYGRRAGRDEIRRLLPEQTFFLWEGHHSTLVNTYGIHRWQEPLRPSLIFLQSCLALAEEKVHPFLERGAVGVIATSTRTYSGSGGALSLAFFDALMYEDVTVGGALRQAKNFMLSFARLKEKRFGVTKMRGANLRAAWSFTLWGDPTVKMPRPEKAASAVAAVKHRVEGNRILVTLPEAKHDKVKTERYEAEIRPNARLAGLVVRDEDKDVNRLVPLVFVEVEMPSAPAGKRPELSTRLPGRRWVFSYDEASRRGWLLLMPRADDAGELRFQVAWN